MNFFNIDELSRIVYIEGLAYPKTQKRLLTWPNQYQVIFTPLFELDVKDFQERIYVIDYKGLFATLPY